MAKTIQKLLIFILSISFFSLFLFLLSKTSLRRFPTFFSVIDLENTSPPPPRIAYFISGSNGDAPRVLRLLQAIYHPNNQYLLHLDRRASQRQREDLSVSIQSVKLFVDSENVNVIGMADSVNYGGSTPIASLLHGAAILLRYSKDWDWFVNLGASDYPLIKQDDFLHVLSFLPKGFNFIQHTSDIGGKEYHRISTIIVDPGLYLATRGEVIIGSTKRSLPTAYRIFTGSPSVILSHKFVEFSILGWNNLPRTLLMYFSNTKSSFCGYFQTLACNTQDFAKTVINSNLRYTSSKNPLRGKHQNQSMSEIEMMLQSGAPFAGDFIPNDPILDVVDSVILKKNRGWISPGGWCLGRPDGGRDPCWLRGDAGLLRPGLGAKRFEEFLLRLMANTSSQSNCTQE